MVADIHRVKDPVRWAGTMMPLIRAHQARTGSRIRMAWCILWTCVLRERV